MKKPDGMLEYWDDSSGDAVHISISIPNKKHRCKRKNKKYKHRNKKKLRQFIELKKVNHG